MIITRVMILDSIREFVLGMRDVVYMVMMITVDGHFVSRPYDWSMKVRETVSVPCQSFLDRCKSQYGQ